MEQLRWGRGLASKFFQERLRDCDLFNLEEERGKDMVASSSYSDQGRTEDQLSVAPNGRTRTGGLELQGGRQRHNALTVGAVRCWNSRPRVVVSHPLLEVLKQSLDGSLSGMLSRGWAR